MASDSRKCSNNRLEVRKSERNKVKGAFQVSDIALKFFSK